MTDLVSQLVGALGECLDDSRSVLADMEQKYGANYRQDRLEFHRQVIAAAEAALTAAKAGGWVAVQNKPAAYRVDWPVDAGVGMRRFYGADEWESSRGTVEFFGGVPVPLAPLPNPPKEQA